MKKNIKRLFLIYPLLIGFLSLSMVACVQSTTSLTPPTLLETVIAYQTKLNTLLDEEATESQAKARRILPTEKTLLEGDDVFDPTLLIPREDFMALYENQRDRSNDVKLSDYLFDYKGLLDQVVTKLEDVGVDQALVTMRVNFGSNKGLDATVMLSTDQGVVVRLTLNFLGKDYYYGVKLGYEEQSFYIREFSQSSNNEGFMYFEFRDEHYMVNVDYRSAQYYRYNYTSQVDNTAYEIYLNKAFSSDDFSIRWFNPKTMVRTVMWTDKYSSGNHFELFNEKGIIFSLTDHYLEGSTWVAWQLLEATGWDAAYQTPAATPFNGVYRDGKQIFSEYRQFNVDLLPQYNLANVRVDLEVPKNELTNDMLNLSRYGMDFHHPELTVEFINRTFDTALEETASLSVFRGIDFLNDDLSTALYAIVDDDVKPR